MKDSLRLCDPIIAATDRVQSRYYINTLSLELGTTIIYGKCSTRAAGDELPRVHPGSFACLACVYGTMQVTPDEAVSFERLAKAYMFQTDVEAKIQVDLSSDITPFQNMIFKLSLVELCHGKPSGISSLESELTCEFYRWANRRESRNSCIARPTQKEALIGLTRWLLCAGTQSAFNPPKLHENRQHAGKVQRMTQEQSLPTLSFSGHRRTSWCSQNKRHILNL